MEKQARYDLNMSGMGTASGGLYNRVDIDGMAKVDGDLDCIDFRINGTAKVFGNLKTERGKVNGMATIKGNVEASEFKINGTTRVDGNISGREMKIEGHSTINGSISIEEVEIRGIANIAGDLSAETFTSQGVFTVGGLLNAGTIDIELYATCKAREVGGEKISVKRGDSFSIRKVINTIFSFLDIDYKLTAETIEGDDIYLEYTKARTVRGNNIILGAGCEIELIEYKNSLEPNSESKVRETRKI